MMSIQGSKQTKHKYFNPKANVRVQGMYWWHRRPPSVESIIEARALWPAMTESWAKKAATNDHDKEGTQNKSKNSNGHVHSSTHHAFWTMITHNWRRHSYNHISFLEHIFFQSYAIMSRYITTYPYNRTSF